MKKVISAIFCFLFLTNAAKADFADHYNAGQQYLTQYQYSSAIDEFKKALRINYLDNSARIGLVNSYLARGTYLANNEKNWTDAANDYRAALFYLKYYATNQEVQNSMQAIANSTQNLNTCLAVLKFDMSPKSRYAKAKDLRLNGYFAEAGYEFTQALPDSSLRKDSYAQIADIMKVLGNDTKSGEYYQKAIDIAPNDGGLHLRYARVLDRLEQSDKAVVEYNLALANGGNDPEILYALERIYRQKLAITPNDAATITNLGAILQKQNKYDDALQYYTQAGKIDPTNVTTRLNIGTLYQQKQSYDAAIEAYNSILFLYPNHKEANLYKAECLAATGQKDQAIAGFKTVLSLDPSNKQAKSELFDLLKTTMSPDQVMAYLNQNFPQDKSTINDLYNYAIELHKQKKFNEAIAYYNQILRVKTDNPEIYINLAIAYEQNNNLAQAKQTLINAKARFPENKQVNDKLAELSQMAVAGKFDDASKLYNSGDYQKSLAAYQAIQPPSFDSLCGIAASYKGLNQNDQALVYYKKALELSPNSDIAYYIGSMLAEKENWDSSKYYLERALAINSNNQNAKDLLKSVKEQVNLKLVDKGIDFYEKNDYPKALAMFNNVLKDDPKNAYSYYYKGMIHDSEKRYQIAIAEYQKAISYNKDLNIVYYLLGIDYDTLAQYKSALVNYKKYVAATTEDNEYKKYAQSRIKELKKYEGN